MFGHADLFAVEEHGSAWQGEHERVRHPHSPLVAAEHGGKPSAQSAPVELHVRLGAEGVENLLALIVTELVEGELVVVAHEVRPLARQVEWRSRPQGLGQRARIAAREER